MAFQDELLTIIQRASNAPFLFVGSGFSRRHIGTDNWATLLSRFCECGKPFEFYASKAHENYPAAAGLLAEDYHGYWFNDPKFALQRDLHMREIRDLADPLKLEIAQHFQRVSPRALAEVQRPEEIVALQSATIDGIITTNWDMLLELIFPDYRRYIGQGAILRSSPTGVAEIYKIHGCCTEPRSLVLTDRDYGAFTKRNHYLAAKLVTIFVEHPVIFIGYSLSDPNIQEMLTNIVNCLGGDHISLLRDRLVFVSYDATAMEPRIESTVYKAEGGPIPITMVHASTYLPIYQALTQVKRKIPTRVLRYLKEQVVQFASTAESQTKVAVLDITDETDLKSVEFVVGVGVTSRLAEKGFTPVEAVDIYEDFLFELNGIPAERAVKTILPRLLKATPNFPVFYYLQKIGIDTDAKYVASQLQLNKAVRLKPEVLGNSVYKHHKKKLAGKLFPEVVATYDPNMVLHYIPLLDRGAINPVDLRGYLRDRFDVATAKNSNFRKAICILDRLENAWIFPNGHDPVAALAPVAQG